MCYQISVSKKGTVSSLQKGKSQESFLLISKRCCFDDSVRGVESGVFFGVFRTLASPSKAFIYGDSRRTQNEKHQLCTTQ